MTPRAIMIADDDPTIRDSLAELLTLEGFCPITAESGREALDLVAQRHPDVILLDLYMPGLTGWDVAHELETQGFQIPIVVMTATPRVRAWARELHANGYLVKPFVFDDVLVALSRVSPPAT